jgi:hypothetical protein
MIATETLYRALKTGIILEFIKCLAMRMYIRMYTRTLHYDKQGSTT